MMEETKGMTEMAWGPRVPRCRTWWCCWLRDWDEGLLITMTYLWEVLTREMKEERGGKKLRLLVGSLHHNANTVGGGACVIPSTVY